MLRFVYHLEEHELLLLDVFDCEETISPKFILDSAAEEDFETISDKCKLAEAAWEIEYCSLLAIDCVSQSELCPINFEI
jgi:hypothetical protein